LAVDVGAVRPVRKIRCKKQEGYLEAAPLRENQATVLPYSSAQFQLVPRRNSSMVRVHPIITVFRVVKVIRRQFIKEGVFQQNAVYKMQCRIELTVKKECEQQTSENLPDTTRYSNRSKIT
jgi:hypothetical protein